MYDDLTVAVDATGEPINKLQRLRAQTRKPSNDVLLPRCRLRAQAAGYATEQRARGQRCGWDRQANRLLTVKLGRCRVNLLVTFYCSVQA